MVRSIFKNSVANKFFALGILTLVMFTGITRATNITINTGQRIEFGQGRILTTTCDTYLSAKLTSEFDGSDANFYVQNLILSDISIRLHSKRVTLALRNDNSNEILTSSQLYFDLDSNGIVFTSPLVHTDVIDYTTVSQFGENEIGTSSITFTNIRKANGLKIRSDEVSRIVLETSKGGGCTEPTISCATVASLCLGTFTSSFTEIPTVSGKWDETCFAENEGYFYGLEVSNGLYRSSAIPGYGSSFSSVTLSSVVESKFASGSYYGLGCSRDGKYIIVGGTNNQIRYSSDFGANWTIKNTSSFQNGGTVASIAISDDGNVVAIMQNSFVNFWVNGNFWASSTSNANAYTSISTGNSVAMSSSGDVIWGGGGSTSKGLYRWSSTQFSNLGNKVSVAAQWNSVDNKSNVFGQYIRYVATSSDGNVVAITSITNSKLYVTRDKFVTYYEPSNLATSVSNTSVQPISVSISSDGKGMAVSLGAWSNQSTGTTQSSNNYGESFVSTAFTGRYMQTISISPQGRRIVTGGFPLSGGSKLVLLGVD